MLPWWWCPAPTADTLHTHTLAAQGQSEAAAASSAAALSSALDIPYTELSAAKLQSVPIEELRQAWSSNGNWGPVVAPPVRQRLLLSFSADLCWAVWLWQ